MLILVILRSWANKLNIKIDLNLRYNESKANCVIKLKIESKGHLKHFAVIND